MKPRKFLYRELTYMRRRCDLIKLTKKGLELQREGQPFKVICEDGGVMPFEIIVDPTSLQWKDFFHSVRDLKLKPKEPDNDILDGFEVKCHIVFREVLLKFDIINPNFENFEKLRKLINQLTICEDYPKGLLDHPDEE